MKRNAFKQFLMIFAVFSMLFSSVGCDKDAPAKEKDLSLQAVLDAGQLVLGLDASFPPMGFIDDENNIVGFDIDVAEEASFRLGVKLVKKPINWEEKEDLLNAGEIDCIWNGMSVSAARAESMNLSGSYMKNEMIFVVRKDSDIKSISGLKGKAVGVQSGSTAQELLQKSKIYEDVTVTSLADNVSLLTALSQEDLDAVFLDSVVAYYYIVSFSEDLLILPGNLGEEEYAVGFRKKDQALRDKVQEILDEMRQDGKLAEISVKWFGSDITTLK